MAQIHAELVENGYEFTQEDLFHAERYMSFNLCSTLNVISILKKIIYPETPDISLFLAKAANAFLPKLVYQLEEYGLPRTISRKIKDIYYAYDMSKNLTKNQILEVYLNNFFVTYGLVGEQIDFDYLEIHIIEE